MILAFPDISPLEILSILTLCSLRNEFNGPISPSFIPGPTPATSPPFDLDSFSFEHVDDEIDLRCDDSKRFFGGDSTWLSASAAGSLNIRLDMIGSPAVGESAASFWNLDLRDGAACLGGRIPAVGLRS